MHWLRRLSLIGLTGQLATLASMKDRQVRIGLLLGMLGWTLWGFVQQPNKPTLDASTLDHLIGYRWVTPRPDPEIVIVDIDEASLASMNAEFGRWPWPRTTMADVLYWMEETQGAQAVLFDILFADPDTLNPAADAAFDQAVGQSQRSYFPVLRLNPKNDSVSKINISALPGFVSPVAASPANTTLAAVVPLFKTVIDSRRLGYHNVYADNDGVNRHYRYWEDKGDWRIWSLPARMAQDLGWGLPKQSEPLINWPKSRNPYPTVSFREVWQLSQTRAGQAPDVRFTNKIVIIGATATSLFDVSTTPIATIHPGVHLLATAIDNAKNHRYLLHPPRWLDLLLTVAALLAMFWASKRLPNKHIKWAAVITPSVLIAVGFVSLQWGRWYLDFTAVASQAFVFFGAVSAVRHWRLQQLALPNALGEKGYTQAWALHVAGDPLPTLVLDHLLVTRARMSVQLLTWQRESRQNEFTTELWLVRLAASTSELLQQHATVFTQQLEDSPIPITIAAIEPQAAFAWTPTKSLWQRLRHTLCKTGNMAPPFAKENRELVGRAMAYSFPTQSICPIAEPSQ